MNNNMFYRNYNPYFRYPYQNHMFYPSSYYNNMNKENNHFESDFNNVKDEKNTNLDDKIQEENKSLNQDENKKGEEEENNNRSFKFGPINFCNNRLSIFGFSFALDDLIIVALIVFLLLESDCDYILIIVLGLMLLDINLSSLNLFT